MEEQLKQLQEAIEDKLKKAASKEALAAEVEEINKKIKAIQKALEEDEDEDKETSKKFEGLKSEFDEKLKAQWEQVEKTIKKAEPVQPMSFGDRLKAAFAAQNLIKQETDHEGRLIEGVNFDVHDRKAEIRVKAAFDMNTAGTTASVSTGYQTNWTMTPVELPLSRDQHLWDVFSHSPLAAIERYFAKVIEYEETDGTGLKTETTAAGDSSFKLKTEDFKVFDYAVKFRVHKNMLATWTGLQARIQALGFDRLKSKISSFVLDAAAAGNGSTVPYGMLSTARFTAYNLLLRAGSVQKANIVDVIRNSVLQAELAETDMDTIMLNPVDIAQLQSLKDGNDNKINQSGLVVNDRGELSYIHGLRIVKTKKITANTFILVNSREAVEFGDKFNLETRLGYDKDSDFSKGIVTIQLENQFAIGLGDPKTIIYCSDIAAAAAELSPSPDTPE
jgi:HK97 family phage major capsid protein